MKVRESIERYLEWMVEVRNPSPHTMRAYAGDIRQWGRHVGGEFDIRKLPSDCVVSFVQSQRSAGLAERTLVRRVAAVRGLHKWLVSRGLVEVGTWELEGIQVSRRRSLPRLAPSRDLGRLHSQLRRTVLKSDSLLADVRAQPDWATTLLAVSIMLATGLRVSEAASIALADVDVNAGGIRVLGKGGRDRTVYVPNQWLRDLIAAYALVRVERGVQHGQLLFNRSGDRLTAASIRHRLRTASITIGLTSHITPHMLRHAAATGLLEADVDIRIVQRLLGHASITTTEIYTHVTDQALRRALDSADVLGRRFLDDN